MIGSALAIGIACSAALLAFCLVAIASNVLLRDKLQVAERMVSLKAEGEGGASAGSAQAKKPKLSLKAMFANKKKSQRTRKQLEKLETELYDAGMQVPVESFMVAWLCITLAVPAVLALAGAPLPASMAAAVACAFLPLLWIKIRKQRRRAKLETQLVDAITVLVSALKAGHSFQSAMNDIARDMEAPISEEFGRVFRETQRGMSLDESMERMSERVGSEDLSMLCTAISIQRQVGGNLAEVLENIAATVKSRLDLKAEIKTRTASGRVSGYIIGALPIVILLAVSVMNPEYTKQLFEPDGRLLLVIGGVMEVIGFIVINKIVSVKY